MYADQNGNIIDDDEEFKINENEEEKNQWEQPQFNEQQD